MSENNFQVLMSGKLVDGMDPAQVKANVAALFKVDVAKVEKLFSGQPVVIKKGLDEATAKKYQAALQRAGAICQVADANAGVSQPAPQPASGQQAAVQSEARAPQTNDETGDDRIPSIDSGLHKYVIKEAPKDLGELGNAQLDEPGTQIVAPQDTPPPAVDTSALSMDEPGVTLVEKEEAPELEVDLSTLSMDEPGVTLVEKEPDPELELDLSQLSMDEPGVTLVEKEEEKEPEIDTSKLSLGE